MVGTRSVTRNVGNRVHQESRWDYFLGIRNKGKMFTLVTPGLFSL